MFGSGLMIRAPSINRLGYAYAPSFPKGSSLAVALLGNTGVRWPCCAMRAVASKFVDFHARRLSLHVRLSTYALAYRTDNAGSGRWIDLTTMA
eukprot:scaffold303_cov46-Attheya_sp.AAC.4